MDVAKPTIVCLIGSTRFRSAWERAILRESLQGKIVLSVACYPHADGTVLSLEQRDLLDQVHLHKIEMADEVLVIDVNGYVGGSTKEEIAFAESLGKRIRYLTQEDDQ